MTELLTTVEVDQVVDRLNRSGRAWPLMLESLPGRVLRVDRTERTWKVVMRGGETFTNLDEAGWLYTGVGATHDGINRDRTRGPRLSR